MLNADFKSVYTGAKAHLPLEGSFADYVKVMLEHLNETASNEGCFQPKENACSAVEVAVDLLSDVEGVRPRVLTELKKLV